MSNAYSNEIFHVILYYGQTKKEWHVLLDDFNLLVSAVQLALFHLAHQVTLCAQFLRTLLELLNFASTKFANDVKHK